MRISGEVASNDRLLTSFISSRCQRVQRPRGQVTWIVSEETENLLLFVNAACSLKLVNAVARWRCQSDVLPKIHLTRFPPDCQLVADLLRICLGEAEAIRETGVMDFGLVRCCTFKSRAPRMNASWRNSTSLPRDLRLVLGAHAAAKRDVINYFRAATAHARSLIIYSSRTHTHTGRYWWLIVCAAWVFLQCGLLASQFVCKLIRSGTDFLVDPASSLKRLRHALCKHKLLHKAANGSLGHPYDFLDRTIVHMTMAILELIRYIRRKERVH